MSGLQGISGCAGSLLIASHYDRLAANYLPSSSSRPSGYDCDFKSSRPKWISLFDKLEKCF